MELCQARSSSEHFKNTEIFAMNSFAVARNLMLVTCHIVGLANAYIKRLVAMCQANSLHVVSRHWEHCIRLMAEVRKSLIRA